MNQNRYTRLKAIKEFGYDINWNDLRQYHIGIVGVGGLGCVSAEMAVRCGVGKVSWQRNTLKKATIQPFPTESTNFTTPRKMEISWDTCYGRCSALQKKWCLSHGFHYWFPKN
ncbi:MAG: ThiF family adenylyltransferase [Promethearchaeota archaeon]